MNAGSLQSSNKIEGLAFISWDTSRVISDNTFDAVSFDGLKRKLSDGALNNGPNINNTSLNASNVKRSKPGQEYEGAAVSAQRLACPFWKRDCLNEALSGACKGKDWGSIGRLNEHLSRRHLTKNQCSRCCQEFNNATNLTEHQRNPVACEVINASSNASSSSAITLEHFNKLKDLIGKHLNGSNEDRWTLMYKYLFPADNVVPSPYRDEPCVACSLKTTSRVLGDLRQHQAQTLMPLVTMELAAISESHNMSNNLCADLAHMFSRLSVRVLDEFQDKNSVISSEQGLIATSSHIPETHENSTYETMIPPQSDDACPQSFAGLLELRCDLDLSHYHLDPLARNGGGDATSQ
ncbi:hypothetical protein F5Y08DRAFT_294030 [Xylaria arbuscula]|nr:hypothetical protein F5Y08DRAFT_294030 [Xylaria arbuscula]